MRALSAGSVCPLARRHKAGRIFALSGKEWTWRADLIETVAGLIMVAGQGWATPASPFLQQWSQGYVRPYDSMDMPAQQDYEG